MGFIDSRQRLYRLIDRYADSLLLLLDTGNCADSRTRAGRRAAERALASRIGVPGTPTLVIGRLHPANRVVGWVIVGAPPGDSLLNLLERMLEGTR